jgi:putative toxin-antitoxin system antitoxin component (TIGR02293 family)
MTRFELDDIVEVLGGTKVIRKKLQNRNDFIQLSHAGIPKISLFKLAEKLDSSVADIAKLVPVSVRTIQRKGRNDPFNKLISERILTIAEVVARGDQVFEDRGKFLAWLHQPSVALGNKTPFSLLDSKYGADMVLDELGRIEYGIVA